MTSPKTLVHVTGGGGGGAAAAASMSSDIYTPFDYSDNLVSFFPYFCEPLCENEDDFLRVVTAGSPPEEDLSLPQLLSLQDQPPPPQFHGHLVLPSCSSVEEGSMQRSYSPNCAGTPVSSPLFVGDGGEGLARRAYSTGDLQRRMTTQSTGDGALVVRGAERYSAEERKERIEKYRAKRNLRNFNKTIKYACRKTLADSRPRIRGRFARNDDVAGEYPNDNSTAAAAIPPPPPRPTMTRHHQRLHVIHLMEKDDDELTEVEYMNQLHGWVRGGVSH